MSSPKLLAIETSGSTGSVALALGGEILEQSIATPREQTERVLEIVDALLAEAGLALGDLDALAFGRGPGSFTGLRVAAAVVQGLALASGLPIVRVSSLAGLAQRGLTAAVQVSDTEPARTVSDTDRAGAGQGAADAGGRPKLALCCIDARMGEVYTGLFRLDSGLALAVGEERIGAPADVAVPDAPFLALGDGFAAHAEMLDAVMAAAVATRPEAATAPTGPFVRARDLLPLARAELTAGRLVPLEAAIPVYLRGADAWRRA